MVRNVPPSNTILSAVRSPGFTPKPVEAEIDILPALIVVIPSYVFTPERVKVPFPNFVKPPSPLITPPIS